MSNFAFLNEIKEYEMFSLAAIEAERTYTTSPAMCAVGCRKALELSIKWVYSVDNTMIMPYKDNLQSLIHDQTFRFAVDTQTWGKLSYIVSLGNIAVHTSKSISKSEAIISLKTLFEFIQWIDYCYGNDDTYSERTFDESIIPKDIIDIDIKKIKEQESLLEQKNAEIQAMKKLIEAMSAERTAAKENNKKKRKFKSEDCSEYETRKIYIDINMKLMGWEFDGVEADVWEEYPVDDLDNVVGKKGFVDYVLFGKDKLPLAVVEAKKTSKDPNIGRQQAVLYADCLERKFGRRPMMFTTNGFETYFWDDRSWPQREVSGIFSKNDLQKLMNRRYERNELISIPIDDKITDRYYQKEAIRSVCDQLELGFRKHLLVMATGTGKTRTASSLTDVLSRGKHITNVLFLADRTELVKQAKDDFKNYLPDMSLCNLCTNKDERNARIVFSTYPTILNAIDSTVTKDGLKMFTPAHFDLIIIDESHRSIFKKYRAIFEYFDAILVGLTATPKNEVDRNTYDFFEMENNVPTYAYDYETAVKDDHVLVPYYNYEVKTKFLDVGITYNDLSDADKIRYEEDFIEDDYLPEFIPSEELNKFVFNETTVDIVLQDLMERGIRVAGGDRIGKTIIFAQNKRHAEFIIKRFNKLYPKYNGTFAQRVLCEDSHSGTIIKAFKIADREPHIVVSVDMMDTGIDVPECVNLVFFKKVRSKTKFWQMIGRGTRLCPELICSDQIDGEYINKRRFLIFDYCGNFEFFRAHKEGYESNDSKSLSESIFIKRIKLAVVLQGDDYMDDKYESWRDNIVDECHQQICELDTNIISVRLKLRYVEKYRNREIFDYITEINKAELIQYISPIVKFDDNDELAKRFDNFMYGMILSYIDSFSAYNKAKIQLVKTTKLLSRKKSIPQVKAKMSFIKNIISEGFWDTVNILILENIRKELRELIKFIDKEEKRIVVTHLTDPIEDKKEGELLEAAYDFEDYKEKVNRYLTEHSDSQAIHKLTHNIPLSADDYKQLEKIFTSELGSKEDYEREYGDTPFGLLIRKICKLDHEATMKAFSDFINDQSLNQKQISFVYKIINHIEQNGYMDSVTDLTKPPFDRPVSFIKLFDDQTRAALVATINKIKENAVFAA